MMRKISDHKINFIMDNIKECPFCNKPVKGYKKYQSDNGKMVFKIPSFSCDCMDRKKYLKVEDNKEEGIQALLKSSHIDKEFLENEFPVYRDSLMRLTRDLSWVDRGEQILIYGDPGNHKTGQVTALMKQIIRDKIYKCLYYRATEIPVRWLEYKQMVDCRLLVIDNFAKDESENRRGSLFDVLDKRIHEHRSNILIVNSDLEKIKVIYSSPLISRLGGFTQIEIDGPDLRQKIDFRYGKNQQKEETNVKN